MQYEVNKDPDADLDYGFDWTPWLGADTIATSTWEAQAGSGLTIHGAAIVAGAKKTVVWLKSGTVSAAPYAVINHIVTAAGREDERSLRVVVVQR